jgi:hypothetical protein
MASWVSTEAFFMANPFTHPRPGLSVVGSYKVVDDLAQGPVYNPQEPPKKVFGVQGGGHERLTLPVEGRGKTSQHHNITASQRHNKTQNDSRARLNRSGKTPKTRLP